MSASPTDSIISTFSDTATYTYATTVVQDPWRAWLAFGALCLAIGLIFVLREATRDGINPE